MNELFLSASIPVHGRKFFEGSDPTLIHAAVRAFAILALGRRHIVWGGHPSITPMIWAACEYLGVEYAHCATLYQSTHFAELFPEENRFFKNVRYIEKRENEAESIRAMRMAMMERSGIAGAVFIGGMEGVEEESSIFRELHANKPCLFLLAPGGAAGYLANTTSNNFGQRPDSTDFTAIFTKVFGINTSEVRAS